jgi:hypothetical protein
MSNWVDDSELMPGNLLGEEGERGKEETVTVQAERKIQETRRGTHR